MKILVCYSSSEKDRKVIEAAVERAKTMNATIYIVTSMQGKAGTPDSVFDYVKEELKEAGKPFADAGIPCETHLSVRGLNAGDDLIRFADEHEVNEIIIGIEKSSKLDKFLLGSTAQH
ncbi:MAG: universal stress protein, partial [Deltaproteobacteria bacterium]|nr:universal stress protein [Deltaproteobacteria bacterium]